MCFLCNIDSIVEPESYLEAVQDANWVNAMKLEIDALERNHTWDIVPLPKGRRPIGCKWVYKVKYRSDGSVDRYKARLVAKGYTQREGIDYHETFSPVVKMTTVRIIIKLAVMYHWNLYQMDVDNAFLQGDLHEEVYMTIPQGFHSQGGMVCKLNKSLYGLKQASRQWNAKLCEALLCGGYKRSKHDYSLFFKTFADGIVIVLVYVDDIIVTGSSEARVQEVKSLLHSNFKIKDLGILKYFLGIEIARSTKGVVLSQRKYILDLLADTGMSGCKPLSIPMATNLKLSAYDEARHKKEDLFQDPERYRRLVGKLIYLTATRPDICFSVQVLSQFMNQPMKCHMTAALNVLRYLKQSPGVGVLISHEGTIALDCFCDADWGACETTRRSVTGYLLKLGGSLVVWKTKKQQTVLKSSAEAEYRALRSAVSEVV